MTAESFLLPAWELAGGEGGKNATKMNEYEILNNSAKPKVACGDSDFEADGGSVT